MPFGEFQLKATVLFEQELMNALDYIETQLLNPQAADKLQDDVEAAVHERIKSPFTTDLAFYCSFDSESVLHEKGSNYIKGAIVPGKVGNVLSIPAHTAAAEFTLPGGVLGTRCA